MLTFYTNPQSRGRIARWMLEETGQPYDTVALEYYTSMKAAEYLAVNPMGKVPALVHDGRVVTENAAICSYLAMAFPDAGLMAEDKASFFRWMFFAAGPLEQAIVNTSFGWLTKDQQEKRRAGYGDLEDVLRAISGHLQAHDYIADGRFTAADVYVGSQLGWGLQSGAVPANDAFSAYWARLKDRPALASANAKDNALIAEM
ncbi:MAG: glutathione S-transferase family protein, partial [Acetobacteraceae bacterium]